MFTVALTGNAASGKSTVAELWRSEGVPVADADEMAREAVRPGSEGLAAVTRAFGSRAIGLDGTLDRSWMREHVFGDDDARGRLEAIVHPEVRRLQRERMSELARAGVALAAFEVALLFETGGEDDFDSVVLVDAHPAERRRRLVDVRGLGGELADRMMAAQADSHRKRARSDLIIDNNGSRFELGLAARRTLAELRQRAAMPLRMDLHVHTWASFDSLSDPELVLDHALRRGLGRIAITDHDRLWAAKSITERFPSLVIAGEEVATAEGIDVIGLYLTEEIPRGTPAREAITKVRDQGGIPYLPHPFAAGKGGGGRLAPELGRLCDVIEVFNGRLHARKPQAEAARLCERLGKLRGAGSDAHTLREVGRSWVEVPAHPNEPEAFAQALSTGTVSGRASSHLVHLASTWAKVRKKIARGPWSAVEPRAHNGAGRLVL